MSPAGKSPHRRAILNLLGRAHFIPRMKSIAYMEPTVSIPEPAAVTRADKDQFRAPRNARRSKQRDRDFGGLLRSDRLLVANEQPPLGSHLITPRRGFAHHGIYVGRGNVVHYRSVVRRFCRGPVEEVSLASFAQERGVWVRRCCAPRFDATEVIHRARSRLGEDRYRLLSNNCEHFCEWCLRGEQRSYQAELLLEMPRRLARACRDVLANLVVPEDNRALAQPIRVLRALPRTAARNLGPAISDWRPFFHSGSLSDWGPSPVAPGRRTPTGGRVALPLGIPVGIPGAIAPYAQLV